MTKYRVVTYNGNTGYFKESLFVYELKDAIGLLKIKCNDIIDDFACDGIRVKVSMMGYVDNAAIRLYSAEDEFNNYYVVFLKEVKED